MKLQVLPLSQEAFSAYGDVIETQQRDFFHINNGLVERYHDLALVEILEQDRTLISIWICPYISRHLLSLNPLQARCRRYSRGER
ncbi:hypothetical protein BBJ11_00050 [Escherichia coli]|nr:hypothetical protein BBJ10_02725 [Escherichia coli]PBT51411.1 hypothetical protein BBJ11_00050 [Escherichia coli]PBT54291.1 hypothetical protein BBJ12_12395 [Escherichia coli]PBT61636.1 hypothetical protein BBJ14_19430 [Escherichia coli]PBT69882.1 hypothetical protein BBJ15_00045 [Escherichia coli]